MRMPLMSVLMVDLKTIPYYYALYWHYKDTINIGNWQISTAHTFNRGKIHQLVPETFSVKEYFKVHIGFASR